MRAHLGAISRKIYELKIQIMTNFFPLYLIIIIKLGHTFAHVTSVLMSWHVQNYDLIRCVFVTHKHHVFSQHQDVIKILRNGSQAFPACNSDLNLLTLCQKDPWEKKNGIYFSPGILFHWSHGIADFKCFSIVRKMSLICWKVCLFSVLWICLSLLRGGNDE